MVMVRMSIGSRHRHFGSSLGTEIVEKSTHSMQAVQELVAYAKNHGLFRAASACDVTCSLLSLMFPWSCCAGSSAGSSSRFQFLRKARVWQKSVLDSFGGCCVWSEKGKEMEVFCFGNFDDDIPSSTNQDNGHRFWRAVSTAISWHRSLQWNFSSAILRSVHLGRNFWRCVTTWTWTWPFSHHSLLAFWVWSSWFYTLAA